MNTRSSNMTIFRFTNANGTDMTGTDAVAGCRFDDYFATDRDIDALTDAELRAAYKGPDWNGVGVVWGGTPPGPHEDATQKNHRA
jgi:hypothetical protein